MTKRGIKRPKEPELETYWYNPEINNVYKVVDVYASEIRSGVPRWKVVLRSVYRSAIYEASLVYFFKNCVEATEEQKGLALLKEVGKDDTVDGRIL